MSARFIRFTRRHYVESIGGGIAEVHAARERVLISVIDEWGRDATVALDPEAASTYVRQVEAALSDATAHIWPEGEPT